MTNKFNGMTLNNYTEYNIEFCFYSNDTYRLYILQYINEIKLIEKNLFWNLLKKK